METTLIIAEEAMGWVDSVFNWMMVTEIVPGLTFFIVLIGSVIISLGIHFIQSIFRSEESYQVNRVARSWRKHG